MAKKCKTCIYGCNISGENTYCQYILIKSQRRGCPAERCSRYVRGKRIKDHRELEN